MERERILASLEELRAEIDRLDEGAVESRARLQALLADIEHRLDNPDDEVRNAGLLDELRKSVEQFEVEHPRATGILNHIMVTLSNMGI